MVENKDDQGFNLTSGFGSTDYSNSLTFDASAYFNYDIDGDSWTGSTDEDGNWTYTWKDLPAYSNGAEIDYTVSEVKVDHYISSKEKSTDSYGDITWTVTNTYTVELPMTGGIGTRRIYLIGLAILAVAACGLGVTYRRQRKGW